MLSLFSAQPVVTYLCQVPLYRLRHNCYWKIDFCSLYMLTKTHFLQQFICIKTRNCAYQKNRKTVPRFHLKRDGYSTTKQYRSRLRHLVTIGQNYYTPTELALQTLSRCEICEHSLQLTYSAGRLDV